MLAATPALIWMFLGLGLPWTLVILPRRDWRDRADSRLPHAGIWPCPAHRLDVHFRQCLDSRY